MTETPESDAAAPTDHVVRAAFLAAPVPGVAAPWDTIHAKVHYPAVFSGDDAERLSGDVAVDPARTPLPVVIFLNGINVGPEAYGWLAQRIAAAGCAVVTFSWVTELFPGQYGISCGLDVGAITPDTYGTRPSANAVAPLLEALAVANAGSGPLAGALDLDRVALGGHSAGATIAYENASPEFFPALRCAFGYGGHTMASTVLGTSPSSTGPTTSVSATRTTRPRRRPRRSGHAAGADLAGAIRDALTPAARGGRQTECRHQAGR